MHYMQILSSVYVHGCWFILSAHARSIVNNAWCMPNYIRFTTKFIQRDPAIKSELRIYTVYVCRSLFSQNSISRICQRTLLFSGLLPQTNIHLALVVTSRIYILSSYCTSITGQTLPKTASGPGDIYGLCFHFWIEFCSMLLQYYLETERNYLSSIFSTTNAFLLSSSPIVSDNLL